MTTIDTVGAAIRRMSRPPREHPLMRDADRYQLLAWAWIGFAVVAFIAGHGVFGAVAFTNALVSGGVAAILRHLGAIRLDNAQILINERRRQDRER